jgi:hypothetical protein
MTKQQSNDSKIRETFQGSDPSRLGIWLTQWLCVSAGNKKTIAHRRYPVLNRAIFPLHGDGSSHNLHLSRRLSGS